ncbi:hypothetical protein, partial [Zavarzinella formosa]|uniref:hypothetical protein n=1 Tax=Zavarzinella formosa TaxID=360055 RepID=UPI001EE6461D
DSPDSRPNRWVEMVVVGSGEMVEVSGVDGKSGFPPRLSSMVAVSGAEGQRWSPSVRASG